MVTRSNVLVAVLRQRGAQKRCRYIAATPTSSAGPGRALHNDAAELRNHRRRNAATVALTTSGVAAEVARSVLAGDCNSFERFLQSLREECVATKVAAKERHVRQLAAELGQAALSADADGFDAVAKRLAEEAATSGIRSLFVPEQSSLQGASSPHHDVAKHFAEEAMTNGTCSQPLVKPSSSAEQSSLQGTSAPEQADSWSVAPALPREHAVSPVVAFAPPAVAATVQEQFGQFAWSRYAFNHGEVGNAEILSSFEENYAKLFTAAQGDLSKPEVLAAALDLVGAYIKNYQLDKADLLLDGALGHCRKLGEPWSTKCLQEFATLRFKQNRQPECVELLEEIAAAGIPHPAIEENLGTAYNSLGDPSRALECFGRAVALKGGIPEKEDLWNLGIARKNLGQTELAVQNIETALRCFVAEDGHCPVTVAKVHDSLAEALLEAGDSERASEEYRHASDLYAAHVGTCSPLYGAAADGLSRALAARGRTEEAFDALLAALAVQARMDGIHPTPLYELLARAEQLVENGKRANLARVDLLRLEADLEEALTNLAQRGLDEDGNGGVVLHKAGQVFLECAASVESKSSHGKDLATMVPKKHQQLSVPSVEEEARRLRGRAAELLRRGLDLMEDASAAGEADLSELCTIASLQLGLVEARLDAEET